MLKKVFLALFGLFIAAQTAGVYAWGSYMRSQTKAEVISAEEYPDSILVDSTGQIWVQPRRPAYSDDLVWKVYRDGKLAKTIETKNEPNFPAKIAMDARGNLFGVLSLGLGNGGIRVVSYNGSTWNQLTELASENRLFISAFAAGSQDDIWIGEIGQLFHYNGSEWQTFTPENSSLPNASINTIFIDSRKRVWLGTGSGAAIFENGKIQLLSNSAPAGYIYSFAEDKDGTIWAGGEEGVFSFNGTQFTRYDKNLNGSRFYKIAVDSSNRVWALSAEGDLSVIHGATTKYLFEEPGNSIQDIAITADEKIYLMRTKDISTLKADVPLVNAVTLKFLWLLHNGVFVYLGIFLAFLWIAVALNSWGVGLGLALTGLIFWGIESFALFDINGVHLGYLNPGFALTFFAFIGGLVGYFFKRRGVKYADSIGSGVGCLGGAILLACLYAVVLLFLVSRA